MPVADPTTRDATVTEAPVFHLFHLGSLSWCDRHSNDNVSSRDCGKKWACSHSSFLLLGPSTAPERPTKSAANEFPDLREKSSGEEVVALVTDVRVH